MASKGIEVCLVLVLVTIFSAGGAMAQPDCTNVILTMASCLDYVSGTVKTPPASCCSALANVVQTNPQCLCAVINGGAQLGVSINTTLALSLPVVCNVKTPPVSRCNETSPGPAGSAGKTANNSTTPPGTGSKTTPGDASTSNGSVTKMNVQLVGFLVLLVSTFVLHSAASESSTGVHYD